MNWVWLIVELGCVMMCLFAAVINLIVYKMINKELKKAIDTMEEKEKLKKKVIELKIFAIRLFRKTKPGSVSHFFVPGSPVAIRWLRSSARCKNS